MTAKRIRRLLLPLQGEVPGGDAAAVLQRVLRQRVRGDRSALRRAFIQMPDEPLLVPYACKNRIGRG